MTIPLALFASSYNEEEANGSTVQNSKSSYTPVKNNKNNYILGNNDNNDYSKNKNPNPNLRKTIKHKPTAPNESKLAALLKSMDEASDSENDDDSSNLANYKGSDSHVSGFSSGSGSGSGMFPPLPELNYRGPAAPSSSTPNETPGSGSGSNSDKNSKSLYTPDIPTSSSGAVSNSTYNDMPSSFANQYYKQFVPYLNQSSSEMHEQPKGELMEKINYIIDLLEDQQDYKTNSIFEDLILYAFLGIFVIFIVDSFSKSGKYVR
jgi:hypothetical protein